MRLIHVNLLELCPKMCFARIGLMGALEEDHVRNEGWRLWFCNQGVCVQCLAWIGATMAEI